MDHASLAGWTVVHSVEFENPACYTSLAPVLRRRLNIDTEFELEKEYQTHFAEATIKLTDVQHLDIVSSYKNQIRVWLLELELANALGTR